LGSVSNTILKFVGSLKVTILAVSADGDTFHAPWLFVKTRLDRHSF